MEIVFKYRLYDEYQYQDTNNYDVNMFIIVSKVGHICPITQCIAGSIFKELY